MSHDSEFCQEPEGKDRGSLIDADVAHRFYWGDGVESAAVTTAETILELCQTQPYLYEALETRFDKIRSQGRKWADRYLTAALKTFRLLHLSAEIWERTPPPITQDILKKCNNHLNYSSRKEGLRGFIQVLEAYEGNDLIPLICQNHQQPTVPEIVGMCDVFLPWQAARRSESQGRTTWK